jgi:hypothetical protein
MVQTHFTEKKDSILDSYYSHIISLQIYNQEKDLTTPQANEIP